MGKRLFTILAVIALGLTALSPATAVEGADRGYTPLEVDGIEANLVPELLQPDRQVGLMLELAGIPVALEQAAAIERGATLSQADRAAIRKSLQATQDRLLADIRAAGGEVRAQLQDAYNGIRVRAAASAIPALAALDGVVAVHRLELHEPDNVDSVPFLGTPEVWESLGLTGENITIGIIDTGIDYIHADFGGSGDPNDYANNDPTAVEPGTFPTVKVAGGWDFVGDDYNASSNDPAINTPMPDPDPLDCNGHGSHVGGSAAGMGVLTDGTTFTGPYDTTTHSNYEFLVGPGMAPEATLYALKVFGCAGSTDVTVDAINWAVANDLDVINMSLGSPFGRNTDPSAVASTNAAKAGVIVIASAGNSGPSPYITGSPGIADGALSVAAQNSIESTPHVNYIGSTGTIDMQNSNGGGPLPITADVIVLTDDPATTDVDESLGCNITDYPTVTGMIVITFRGVCARVNRAIHGQALGAAAVVMINNTSGFPPFEGPIGGVTIPFLGALQDDAADITATDGESVTIEDGGTVPNPDFRAFASFTSGGPRNGDSAAKPDVIAPGVSIVSAFSGTGSAGITSSGTSMAAPHVAGLAALVREANPTWSVAHVKAAIMNTADPDLMTDYLTRRAGSGVVVPGDAVTTEVVAVTDQLRASLSFGYVEGTGVSAHTKQIRVRNLGSTTASYSAIVDWNDDLGGAATMSVSPTSVTVPPGAQRTLNVTLTVDHAAVDSGFQNAAGAVELVPTSGTTQTLRVPFVEVARGASALTTSSVNAPIPNISGFVTRNLAGATGTGDVYAWSLSDPADTMNTDVNAVGVQAFPDFDFGVFAINTNNALSNPAVNEWDVLLDVDENGTFDYGIIGFDIGAILLGGFDGRLGSFTVDLSDGSVISAFFAGGGLNSSTVLLPFLLSDVGIDAGNPDFAFISAVFSLEDEGDADTDFVDGVGYFDAFTQPVQTGQFVTLDAGQAARWSAFRNPAQLGITPVMGWMVVYTENVSNDQVDLFGLP